MKFNFKEHQVVDTIEKVPEDFQALYVEQEDGKFKLDSTDAKVGAAVSAITRLNTALVASRAEVKKAKEGKVDLSILSEFGEDTETILATFQEQLAAAQTTAKGKGAEDLDRQVAKIKEDLAKGHSKELGAVTDRNTALTAQLYGLLVDSSATSALVAAGVIDPDLARPLIEKQVKVTEEDGQFVVNVVDGAGDIRFSGVTAAPMSIKELVAEMKGQEKYQPLFKSESKSGGGITPVKTTLRPGVKAEEKSSVDKISAGLTAREK
jgi:hypothetical protein